MKRLTSYPWFLSLIIYFIFWLLIASSIDLGADEAHYVLYGMHWDWSYFDHPPLVGWIQALYVKLGAWLGISTQSPIHRIWYRLPSLLSFIWVLFECYYLRVKVLSFWAFSLAIVPGVMSLFFLPDTILLPFCLHLIRVAIRSSTWTTRTSIRLGLLLGLCGLTKYTAILVLPAFFYIAWQKLPSPHLRPKIFPLLAISATALLTISPVLLWNANHDWMSLKYQWNHILGERKWSWDYLGASLVSQWLGYGIILVPLLLFYTYRFLRISFLNSLRGSTSIKNRLHRSIHQTEPDTKLSVVKVHFSTTQQAFLVLGLTVLAFFLKSSPYTFTLLHWTLVGWWALWLSMHDKIPALTYRLQLYTNLTIWAVVIIILHLPLKLPSLNLSEVRGWPELMSEINSQLSSNDCLLISNWSYASRALFYSPSGLQSRIFVADDRQDQFDLWEQKRSGISCQKKYLLVFSKDLKQLQNQPASGHCPLKHEDLSLEPRTVQVTEQKWSHSYYMVRCSR